MFTWLRICFKLFISVGESLFPASINSPVPKAQPPCQITEGLWMPYVNCLGSLLSVRCKAGPGQMTADGGIQAKAAFRPRKSALEGPYLLCLTCSGDFA